MGTNGKTYRPKKKPTKDKAYFKCNHVIFESDILLHLDGSAFKLYTILCKLRNKYEQKLDYGGTFWRADSQLMNDTKLSRNALKKARQELIDAGLIWCSSNLKERKLGPRYILFDYLNKEPKKDASKITPNVLIPTEDEMPEEWQDALHIPDWLCVKK